MSEPGWGERNPDAPPPTDIIPETVEHALEKWDSGESVFTIEMGGLGPGYEQCIQVLAFELMRAWKDEAWPMLGVDVSDELSERLNNLAEPIISELDTSMGFSGAQVAAAKNLASVACRRGYRKAVRDPDVKDRLIQVSRGFPSQESPQ